METDNAADGVSARLADEARRWRQVKPGMSIGVMDVQLEVPVRYESRTFPAICLSVVLEGFAINNMEALEGGFCPDEVWVTSTGESVPTSMTIHAERPVRVVELLLMPHWVADNRQRMAGDVAFQNMAQAMSQPLMVRRLKLDARLRQIAWSALRPPVSGAFVNEHLDACALNMLCILAEYFQATKSPTPADRLGGKGLERMTEVRRHIDADPVAVNSLVELASRFGLSQSGLKRDFQRAFGVTARDYLFERRMLIGRNAILRDRLTIAEAAYRAGYEHPGNFTAAFTKHFGYPPSRLKN
ncbi:AraC-like DNA-binding protein [Peteryoungia aggregata LMG 23059]|uniref:AraC-like DNA-binding protein n=1 Tax=Peteryoungia aggregata LMG 23059 TaxID=1368425 RepID=A0ABU0G4L6_9HYPH|nr:AraC family transcriptional regulator [Peteryoungia aggregata]MDQ0420272.1 AraC-like DNA-binding protein [Peteryoungia aggregata LMG 23059]